MILPAISHSKPDIEEKEIRAVTTVLKSGIIACDGEVERFEASFKKFIKRKYTCALNSGTSALHLSLLALGVNQGAEIILPSYVCTALLNAVSYTGATPVLADVLPEDGNISVDSLKKKITKKTGAIIVPHMFGRPANIKEAATLGIPVIEDCAQSIGASYNGRLTGASGKISVFSFYATKVLAAGEGGMVAADERRVIDSIRDLCTYDGKNGYKVRYNYKMTDLSASLGNIQLSRLKGFIRRRKKIASLYRKKIDTAAIYHPPQNKESGDIYYRYVVRIKKGSLRKIIELFRKRKVYAERPVFKPLHRYLNLDRTKFPGAEECYKKFLSIPIYPSLTDSEVERIVNVSLEIFSEKR